MDRYQYAMFKPKCRLVNQNAAQWVYFEMTLEEIENRSNNWNSITIYQANGYDIIARRKCTGLKDTAGTLIYEGDIVKYNEFYIGFYPIPAGIGIIKYEPCSYCIESINGKDTPEIDENNGLKIIGNIYTNPELV